MAGIPLAEAIADLREELARAIEDGAGQAIRFELGPVEMEFELAVTRQSGGSGKAKFLVFELGAEGTLGQARTHRLKLTLEPIGPGGRRPQISRGAGEPK